MTAPSPLVELVGVMARLRRECAWKAQQTHRSLARYLLEEAHETVEAIESGSAEHLREELGDLLLQVYFHAAIAAEEGRYDIDDVARDLIAKLVRRNPHVFGDSTASTPEEINEAWETIKRTEKQRTDPTEGIPSSLPALLYADKVIDRVTRAGSPFPAPSPSPSPPPSLEPRDVAPRAATSGPPSRDSRPAEPRALSAEEVGEQLVAIALQAHAAGIDAEQALRDAVRRRLPD